MSGVQSGPAGSALLTVHAHADIETRVEVCAMDRDKLAAKIKAGTERRIAVLTKLEKLGGHRAFIVKHTAKVVRPALKRA